MRGSVVGNRNRLKADNLQAKLLALLLGEILVNNHGLAQGDVHARDPCSGGPGCRHS